jgi:tRNA(fMet)-specific endonuclease VapC
MSLKYLVDTDWVIRHLNRKEQFTEKLKEFRPMGVGISIVSVAELYEGVYYSRDPVNSLSGLKRFLSWISVLGLDEEACKIFGQERGRLRQQGMMIADLDLLIASTCVRHDLTLLSNNRSHFERVNGLTIFSL